MEQLLTECKYCKKMFNTIVRKDRNNKHQIYCSKECMRLDKHVDVETRTCKVCGKSFEIKKTIGKQFCSRSCSTKFQMSNEQEKIERVEARKISIFERYGVNDSANIPGRAEKFKQTLINKYGSASYNNMDLRRKTVAKNKITQLVKDGRWELLFDEEDYEGCDKTYPFRCKKCGNVFESNMPRIYPRCTVCYPKNMPSVMEKEILNFIVEHYSGHVIENDRKILDGRELDIYIPEKNLAIEFNGLYWHKEDKTRHITKTKACEQLGITLIQIFEDEWMFRQEIVKSRLISKLNLSLESIFARKCNIRKIQTRDKNDFLNKTHIQGEDKSNVKLGAYYKDELIGVMTFSKLRISLGYKKQIEGVYELTRFSTKLFANTPGLFSKMLKFFINEYSPIKIITYSDNRWNTGNVYIKNGFTLCSKGRPNYWYIVKNKRAHRFNYRKHMLKTKLKIFDPQLTEIENMRANGYDRIWDCGSDKYELVISS